MAETIHEFFVIKAVNKKTGTTRYIEIDNDQVNLVKYKSDATLYRKYEVALREMKKYCESEAINTFTVESIMMSLEEAMTKGE